MYLDLDVELDQVAPEDAKMFRVGGHDLDRLPMTRAPWTRSRTRSGLPT